MADDSDILGNSEVETQIEEHAEHLRTCPECRKKLIEMSRPFTKRVLALVEKEMGRSLSSEERAVFAKSAVIQASLSVATNVAMSGQIIASIEEAMDKMAKSGKAPVTSGFGGPVGEA